MPAGMQIWDSGGTLILDLSTKLARTLGSMTRGSGDAATGSVTDAKFAEGTPWYYCIPTEQATYQGYELEVSISGTTLSWSWPSAYRNATTVVYGVF